ncbi:MAG: nitrogen regulation protein NR(I) [Rhodobacterales bacterium]|nr:MAG: nitrogen regulation protein NR(I) [Rhodobacterales bacterium]
MDGTVLIADDDRTIRTVLTQAFTRAGCKVHATASMVTLMGWVEQGMGDLLISDVMMPDGNGLEMIPEINRLRGDLPVILISAQNTIMTTVKAAEVKAFDYLPKPFDLPDLLQSAARAFEMNRQARKPAAPAGPDQGALPLVGGSAVMQELYSLMARVVNSALPVLILGESGTGKSLLARTLHDLSERRTRPFVVAAPADLADAAAVERAFARAADGTLVLDEVGALLVEAQGRVSQMIDRCDGQGPRIVAISQVDPLQNASDGGFRQDLYYRLNGVCLTMPALRERVEDIGPLAAFFLGQGDGPKKTLSPEALEQLRRHSWPGNVRQLQNVLSRLCATSAAPQISAQEVGQVLEAAAPPAPVPGEGQEKLSDAIARHLQRYFDLHAGALPPPGLYARILHEMETPLLDIALQATGGNQAKCAQLLGINRNTLRKKLTERDIRVTRRRKLM